jgi:hypothetical protein
LPALASPHASGSLEALWDPKVKHEWMNVVAAGNEHDDLEAWQKARRKVPGTGPAQKIESLSWRFLGAA